MVTVNAYHIRQNNEGKPFIALELLGDLEMVQGSKTGRFYATAKKCTVGSTFTEEVAKTLVGKQLPGRIDRVQSEPYEYTIKESGEVITLTHSYAYVPDDKPLVLEKAAKALVSA